MSDSEELQYKVSADTSEAQSKLEKIARSVSDAGTQSARAGTQMGEAGDQAEEAGNQTEEAGNQTEEAGNQAEKAGDQAEKASQKAVNGVKGLGDMVRGLTGSVKGLLQVSAVLNVWTALFRLLEKTVGWVRDKINAWNDEQDRMAEAAAEHAARIADASRKIQETEFKKARDSLQEYVDELERAGKAARTAEEATLALSRARRERDAARIDLAMAKGEMTGEDGERAKRRLSREAEWEQLDADDADLNRQVSATQASLDRAKADVVAARNAEESARSALAEAYKRLKAAREDKSRWAAAMEDPRDTAIYMTPWNEANGRIEDAEKEIGDATQPASLMGRHEAARARREAAEANLEKVRGPAEAAISNAQTRLQANAVARETVRLVFDTREAAAAKRQEADAAEQRQSAVAANARFVAAVREREVAEAPTPIDKLQTRLSHAKSDLVEAATIPDEVEAATAREKITVRILELERQIGEERARQATEGVQAAKADLAEAEKRVGAIRGTVSRGLAIGVSDADSRRGLYGGREGRAVAAPQISGYQSTVKSQLAKIVAAAEKIKQNTRQTPGEVVL